MELEKSVGIIITNSNRSLFYLQNKCDEYPYEFYRGCLAFFGGHSEGDERSLETLHRELIEELEQETYDIISKSDISLINMYKVPVDNSGHMRKPYEIVLFESVLTNDDLSKIVHNEVYEGESILVDRAMFEKYKFIWNLEYVRDDYLKIISENEKRDALLEEKVQKEEERQLYILNNFKTI